MQFYYVLVQMKADCIKPPGGTKQLPKAAKSPVSCDFFFSSPDSPLSSCFRVVSKKTLSDEGGLKHCDKMIISQVKKDHLTEQTCPYMHL